MASALHPEVLEAIRRALAEDVGGGDVTSLATIPDSAMARGLFRAKSPGVVAGLEVAAEVFRALDSGSQFEPHVIDGQTVDQGTHLATVSGPARIILTGERTALNFLQRMSGIATMTNAFVKAVEGTRAIILDTRKTAPGLRQFDKLAVRLGGGTNHRAGLFDMVLIKDNHIDAAGGITAAIQGARSFSGGRLPIEVECRTLDDVREAFGLKVDRIMLDNMDLSTIRKAVHLVDGRIPLEVSGNVTLETVRAYAETGVDLISVGALTHSVKAMDISMKIVTSEKRTSMQ
ncbi:MAG: carboxylating nicotinate-nucleotide diphosphorylase [Bacteroidetes bacterium]|jgi:nicotinate-nucleotide pyrophosphorylase (carboxylating)|nr:carboxylating nicotinate-nucleotide diphosphorylase [Bacteroidota bacterium]